MDLSICKINNNTTTVATTNMTCDSPCTCLSCSKTLDFTKDPITLLLQAGYTVHDVALMQAGYIVEDVALIDDEKALTSTEVAPVRCCQCVIQ
jgi:hypothetical protein